MSSMSRICGMVSPQTLKNSETALGPGVPSAGLAFACLAVFFPVVLAPLVEGFAEGVLSVNWPRSALANRLSCPLFWMSRVSAQYRVACGVLPPGLCQYPLAPYRFHHRLSRHRLPRLGQHLRSRIDLAELAVGLGGALLLRLWGLRAGCLVVFFAGAFFEVFLVVAIVESLSIGGAVERTSTDTAGVHEVSTLRTARNDRA